MPFAITKACVGGGGGVAHWMPTGQGGGAIYSPTRVIVMGASVGVGHGISPQLKVGLFDSHLIASVVPSSHCSPPFGESTVTEGLANLRDATASRPGVAALPTIIFPPA